MLTILVLLVGLTLATAVIAYWSDNLGKKLGKKRVSLWGMRPRTTATFLTIASSWLIMIFTLGVMLTLFPLLRQALLHYDEVKANESKLSKSATQLTGQVGGLNQQLATLTDQTTALKQRVQTASYDLAEVGKKLKLSSQAAARARQARDDAKKAATQAQKSAAAAIKRQRAAAQREQAARANLGKVRAQLGVTQTQRAAAERQLNAAQADLKKANAAVKSADLRVKSATERVKIANGQVEKAETQLANVQTDLREVQGDLRVARTNEKTADANAKLAEARAEKARVAAISAGAKVVEAETKVATLTAQSEQLQSDNDELVRINKNLSDDNKRVRSTAIIFSQSDVLVPVDSTLVEHSFERLTSAFDVRRELRAMFERSAQQIVPALLPNAELKFAELRDGERLLTTDEIYDNLVNFIANNPSALSVRLVAARNHLAGEDKLESQFLVVPIRPAFPDDFELARVDLSGRSNEGPLFSALLDLVDEGTAVAKSKGVKPPLSPDVPNFYVPGSREQIFDTLRDIKAINGPARVRIITAKPISTADQLSVKFEVEPVNSITTQATARLAPR